MANTVSRYQPHNSVTRLPDLMDRLLQESFVIPGMLDRAGGQGAQSVMPVNLYESGDAYTLQLALPGLSADNIDIQVIGREVTVKGTSKSEAPEGVRWIWRGIPNGEFQETYTLPAEVQGDKTQASYEYGILAITLPKAEHLKPRTVQVTVNK